jgi:hypothetical protein
MLGKQSSNFGGCAGCGIRLGAAAAKIIGPTSGLNAILGAALVPSG